MTEISVLSGLSARCERLSEPDRQLDADIFEALGGPAWLRAYNTATQPSGCPHDVAVEGARRFAPRFTASVDAALPLIPDGWWLHELSQFSNINGVKTWHAQLRTYPHVEVYCRSREPSIALLAAALKAHSVRDPS